MIRTVLYRDGVEEYSEGVLHGFAEGCAIVEDFVSGEITSVPIRPGNLKFKIVTKDWVEMQIRAQQEAQAQNSAGKIMTMPGIDFRKR